MQAFKEAARKDPRIRFTAVRSVLDITPHLRRVVLEGPELADFPANKEGGYIKLLFPDHLRPDSATPVRRTYSIRAHDVDAHTLTVDFALHSETGGVAMDWVSSAKPGDELAISGPGTVKMATSDADWYLIAADMTGQPAAMCNIERLPDNAKGYAVFEIPSKADKQDIVAPVGIELIWVVNPKPQDSKNRLLDKIKELDWLPGAPFVWTACEFDTMRALRAYYRNDRDVDKKMFYLSSYWRAGRSEDQHKIDKRKDADENAPPVEVALRGVARGLSRLLNR